MSDGESEIDGSSSKQQQQQQQQVSKKRKASRACDRCNSQHQPCDNVSPRCGFCERSGTDCTYDRPVRKRGPRTGYTAQYGDRLWGLVLQANPDIEDTVLRMLATGTFADTGILNADFFRSSDHQSHLVRLFNESRLGRFAQTGELPYLGPPPLASAGERGVGSSSGPKPVPLMTESAVAQSMIPSAHTTKQAVSQTGPVKHPGLAHDGSMRSLSAVNPHGPIQSPGDVYVQSAHVRKRPFVSDSIPEHQSTGPLQLSPDWGRLANPVGSQSASSYEPAELTHAHDTHSSLLSGDRGLDTRDTNNSHVLSTPRALEQSMAAPAPAPPPAPPPPAPDGSTAAQPVAADFDFDFDLPDMGQWFESIPTDTLLNLGFTAGEGMADDFLELCQNPDPDPAQHSAVSPARQNEDEETVWRRLVLRGRFV